MHIAEYAFSSCDSLTTVKIGSSVAGISNYAFEKCGNLKSISIPKGLTYIGAYAFSGCESIADVYYEGSEWMWNLIELVLGNECLTSATIHYGGDESTESNLTLHHGDLEPHKGMAIATMNAGQTAEKILYEMNALSDRIVDKNGKVLANNDFVGTGAKIQSVRNGNVMGEYTVIVYMDINGDGKITAADARMVLRASAKLEKLEGVFATAANVNYDDKITAADARKILRVSAKLERA